MHGSTAAGAAAHGECNGEQRCAAGAAACRGSMGGSSTVGAGCIGRNLGSHTGMNRQARNFIGEFYGNYYIIFPETRFPANPCTNN